VATVSSGHNITTADKVDVYWSGGKRLGMTVTATTSTTISLDLGSGDNLPALSSAIIVSKIVDMSCVFTGNNVAAIAMSAQRQGCIRLRGSTTDYLTITPAADGAAFSWGRTDRQPGLRRRDRYGPLQQQGRDQHEPGPRGRALQRRLAREPHPSKE